MRRGHRLQHKVRYKTTAFFLRQDWLRHDPLVLYPLQEVRVPFEKLLEALLRTIRVSEYFLEFLKLRSPYCPKVWHDDIGDRSQQCVTRRYYVDKVVSDGWQRRETPSLLKDNDVGSPHEVVGRGTRENAREISAAKEPIEQAQDEADRQALKGESLSTHFLKKPVWQALFDASQA